MTSTNPKLIFNFIISLLLLLVFLSNPFLRYPYDSIHHLIEIDNLYHTSQGVFDIPTGRYIWHYLWAKIFILFQIPSLDLFIRAKIIHIVQTYIALFSIYYFSHVVIRNIFKNIQNIEVQYLALSSVVIWLSVFATYSINYQQVWNMWYSVNYQITLPLFWYITALSIVLFLEKTSLIKKIFFALQILLLSRFILQAHSMEYLYFLMHLFVFILLYIDKVYILIKKYYYIFIPFVLSLYFIAKNYQPENSKIFQYISLDKIPMLYEKILINGDKLTNGYNRSGSAICELHYIILFISFITLMYYSYTKINQKNMLINSKLFMYIIFTSLFFIIPLYQHSSGLFSMITKTSVIHRIYYSSSLFLLIPISLYYLYSSYSKNKISIWYINISIVIILLSTWIYSRYDIAHQQNYYKNVSSIKNSFFERKVGFHLDAMQIKDIGKKLNAYESNHLDKEPFYYARSDIAFVLKYLYEKNVYWEGRRRNVDYIKHFKTDININFSKVLFETPTNFPLYKPYK